MISNGVNTFYFLLILSRNINNKMRSNDMKKFKIILEVSYNKSRVFLGEGVFFSVT